MKKKIKILLMLLMLNIVITESKAQSYEVQCLVLDCSKLAQLKSILSDMKKGYEVLTKGYDDVKDISEGNFHLHKEFLDNLMKVSPVVKNYKKVSDIISDQLSLIKEYKRAWQRFNKDKNFNSKELQYIGTVYNHLTKESLKNLEDLTVIISPNIFRMSDDERLHRIDELADDMHDKLTFLRQFNGKASVLSVQRLHEQNDAGSLQKLYGIK
ncbi:MAG: TerB family tellurite resistance protein [Bacteroidota bacterium]|nr:TerB family tellurite resistance protein [Bacteroidota bacterium]